MIALNCAALSSSPVIWLQLLLLFLCLPLSFCWHKCSWSHVVTWIREELGLEQTVFFAELMWVGSQRGSPGSCGDAGASTRRGQHRGLGALLLLLACVSFKWL